MFRQRVSVAFPEGLHVGPAYQLAKLAKAWPCQVYVSSPHGTFPAKSGMEVLRAGVGPGGQVELICEGEGEQEAGLALTAFLRGEIHSN